MRDAAVFAQHRPTCDDPAGGTEMLSRRDVLISTAGAATMGMAAAANAQDLGEAALPVRVDLTEGWEASAIERGDVSISVGDSPLPNALDVYYGFLVELAEQNGYTDRQKILLNNTITPFDIDQATPYYNEGLFRNYVDRVFRSSPQSLGPANRADRFSLHYEQIIRTAAAGIDKKYKEIAPDLADLQEKLDEQTEKLTDRILAINSQWQKVVSGEGITEEDPQYQLRYLNFLESVRYADQVKQYTQNIDMILATIDAVRRSVYTPDEQLLLDNIAQLSETRKVARPRRPQFERTVKDVTELTFADPTVRNESLMDISPAMYPLGDLVRFLQLPGNRSISITKSSEVVRRHDRSWSGGGSFGYSWFSLGGSGSGSSSYKEDINKSAGISIGFENIAEYLVDRDLWFNPVVFENAELRDRIMKIPGVERLEYVSVSLIIARGITLQLTFDSSVSKENWTKKAFSGSGGVGIFGIGFRASGSSSSYDYSLDVSEDGKTVTFKDDPQLARVLAVRLESLVPVEQGLWPQASPDQEMADPNAPLSRFRRGEITYIELQNAKRGPSQQP